MSLSESASLQKSIEFLVRKSVEIERVDVDSVSEEDLPDWSVKLAAGL